MGKPRMVRKPKKKPMGVVGSVSGRYCKKHERFLTSDEKTCSKCNPNEP